MMVCAKFCGGIWRSVNNIVKDLNYHIYNYKLDLIIYLVTFI